MASDQQLLHKNDSNQPVSPEPLPKRKTCTGYCVYKIIAIIYAIFYVIIGLLLLALGIWIIIIKQEYESINDIVTSPAILCVVVGLIVVITAIVGCIGAAANKLWPLRIFLAIIIVVFIIQVVIGILAYVYREETIASLEGTVEVAIKKYDHDSSVKHAVDKAQKKWQCCGFKELDDWNSNSYYKCGSKKQGDCGVPDSCCKTISEGCGQSTRGSALALASRSLNNRGCKESFQNWIEKNLDILGATALGLAILHILGIFVIYMLITKIEDRIRLFKYRKRFYQS